MKTGSNRFRLQSCFFLGAIALVSAQPAFAQKSFYEGKRLRIMPYTSPGSAHDVLARITARYLTKYIPGHPNIIVQNMPGAGGVTVANYTYKLAKPDGLSVSILPRGMALLWVANYPGVEYDATKFRWVLSSSTDITICLARSATGFESIKDVIGAPKPLIIGATGRAASSFQVAATLKATLGANIKIITGYKGAPEMQMALERKEIDGRCLSYFGTQVHTFLKKGLQSGALRFMVQLPARHPALPGVPVANDLASKPNDVALMNLVAAPLNPWVVPPGTPEDRLAVLRDSFMKAFVDPDFRKAAERAGFEIDPVPGEKAEVMAREVLNVPEKTRQMVREILGL